MSEFNAYIVSFLPVDNPELRESRIGICQRQIRWWLENTKVNVHVISMNYEPNDYIERDNPRLVYLDSPPAKLTPARLVGFKHFYDSDANWGIMMDDDAILYDKPQHKDGFKIFEEMEGRFDKYRDVDVFFPINPQKIGFNPIWNKDPILFEENHVFVKNMDLKGSMFVVKNFRKHGMAEVLPDINFNWQEDTKFAIDCVAAGHTVMQCQNIVLNELSGSASHFSATANARIPKMLDGNSKIAEAYAHLGLKMKPNSHLLDKNKFLKDQWRGPTKVAVRKPQYEKTDLFEF